MSKLLVSSVDFLVTRYSADGSRCRWSHSQCRSESVDLTVTRSVCQGHQCQDCLTSWCQDTLQVGPNAAGRAVYVGHSQPVVSCLVVRYMLLRQTPACLPGDKMTSETRDLSRLERCIPEHTDSSSSSSTNQVAAASLTMGWFVFTNV